jgi:hypothetical protein
MPLLLSCNGEPNLVTGATVWTGTVTVQQRINTQVTEMCFGGTLLSDPPTATGCPGIVVDNYTWLVPPTASELQLGLRLMPVWLEGELAPDRSSFHISKLIDTSTLSADDIARIQDPRPVIAPAGFSCKLAPQTSEEISAIIRANRLGSLPLATSEGVEELPSGQPHTYQLRVAFAPDDIYQRVCQAGIATNSIQIADHMKRLNP